MNDEWNAATTASTDQQNVNLKLISLRLKLCEFFFLLFLIRFDFDKRECKTRVLIDAPQTYDDGDENDPQSEQSEQKKL